MTIRHNKMVGPMPDQDKFETNITNMRSAAQKSFALSTSADSSCCKRITREQRALQTLLDSLGEQPETLLERTLRDPTTQHNVGRLIGYAIAKPYESGQ
jgi:hypothetical protein